MPARTHSSSRNSRTQAFGRTTSPPRVPAAPVPARRCLRGGPQPPAEGAATWASQSSRSCQVQQLSAMKQVLA